MATEVKAVPKEEKKVFVTVPAQTLFGATFPTIRLQWDQYEPGKSYEVSEEVGKELSRIIAERQKYDLRLMNPKADSSTLVQLIRGGALPATGSMLDRNPNTGASELNVSEK